MKTLPTIGTPPALARWVFLLSGSALLAACNGNNTTPDTKETLNDDSESIKLISGTSAEYLEQYLKGGLNQSSENFRVSPPTVINDSLGELAGADSDTAAEGASTSTNGFSETNTQVLGVDESDLVKYDGEHLYIASNQQYYYLYGIAFDTPTSSDADIEEETSLRDEGFAPSPSLNEPAKIRILETIQGSTPSATEIGSITLSETQGNITGLYLHKASNTQQMAVISSSHNYSWDAWGSYASWGNSKTFLTLFDINTPTNALQLNNIEIDGSLIDSRRIDNKLYLVTRYVPNIPSLNWNAYDDSSVEKNKQEIDALTLEELLPKTTTPDGSNKPLVSEDDCYIPESATEDYYSPELVTISSIDLEDPTNITSVCVAGYSSGIFASTEALYLFNDQWNQGTIVHKFGFTEQGTAYKGSGTVPGSLGWRAPSFRLSEKDGALVAISTVFPNVGIGFPTEPVLLEDITLVDADIADSIASDTVSNDSTSSDTSTAPIYPTHTITVLQEGDDDTLTTIATLPNESQPTVIGKPNEDIYAVRYIEDRAYIVTYQKTDPLYVVDLSDVTQPAITGELHIEGYSDYLHPIGEDYLIGVGKSSIVDGELAWIQGVQIGFFNVQDMTSPQLIKQVSIGSRGTETDVSYNHKAFSFLEVGDNSYRMTIPARVHDGEQNYPYVWTDWQYTALHLFDVTIGETSTMEAAGSVIAEQKSDDLPYSSYVELQRGIIHDDAVHYVYGDKVFSANWNNPSTTNTGAQ